LGICIRDDFEVVGVATEVFPQTRAAAPLERGEPFVDFEHRHRQQQPHGFGDEFVEQQDVVPLLLLGAGADLAPAEVQAVGSGALLVVAHIARRRRSAAHVNRVTWLSSPAMEELFAPFGEAEVDGASFAGRPAPRRMPCR
jgi:hypothetical protein